MDKKQKVDGILEKTASELVKLVDVNTVIGKPVFSASGAQIIPFTKVTMGYLSGGGEYGEVKAVKENESFPFAGGAGTVVRITDDPIDGLIEKAGDLLDKALNRDET